MGSGEDYEEFPVFYLGGERVQAGSALLLPAGLGIEAPAVPGTDDLAVAEGAFAKGQPLMRADSVHDQEMAVLLGDAEFAAAGAHGAEAAFFG